MSSIAPTPTAQLVQLPFEDLLAIRRALRDAAGTVTATDAGLAAMKAAHAAYRLCFTPQEQAKVLEHVRQRIAEVPDGHFLRGTQPPADFVAALGQFGTSVIHQALGPEA